MNLFGIAGVLACVLFGRELAHVIGVELMGYDKSPVSGVILCVIIGIVLANAAPRLVAPWGGTLHFFATNALRVGIVLLGLRLSLVSASELGLKALPVVLICIAVALTVVTQARRAFGLSRELSSLIAVGTSICGITAIAATAPLIRAREVDVSYATGCIAIFGIFALLAYPLIAHALFADDPVLAGIFLGTSVHDTAQVAGAALLYQEQFGAQGALEAATVTKLLRNAFMALIIPLAAIYFRAPFAGHDSIGDGAEARANAPVLPLFVIGFIAMCALRTIGDMGTQPFGVLQPAQWKAMLNAAQAGSDLALAAAMAAVGLQTRIGMFFALGVRPLLLGLLATLLVCLVSSVALLTLAS